MAMQVIVLERRLDVGKVVGRAALQDRAGVALDAAQPGRSSRGAGALHEGADGVADEVVGNGVGVGEEFDREAVGERD